MRNAKYVKIDRELLLKLVNKSGSAAFGASINRSKAWVNEQVRNGYMDVQVVEAVKKVYGVNIEADIVADKPHESVTPEPKKETPPATEPDYKNELSELINRVDKMERNINNIDLTLRMILDAVDKIEKRSRNKPYAKI